MAALSYAAFIAKYETYFADNTTQAITESVMREFKDDIGDSLMFLGGGTIITRDTLISSADILSANSTPVTLVNAPGAGFMIVPVTCTLFYDYVTAAYATNTTFGLYLQNQLVSSTNNTLITSTSDRWATLTPVAFENSVASVENKDLTFQVQTGNPTAGSGTLFVRVVYYIAATAS